MSIIGQWKIWDGEWDQAYKELMPKAGMVLGGIHAALDPSVATADPGIHTSFEATQQADQALQMHGDAIDAQADADTQPAVANLDAVAADTANNADSVQPAVESAGPEPAHHMQLAQLDQPSTPDSLAPVEAGDSVSTFRPEPQIDLAHRASLDAMPKPDASAAAAPLDSTIEPSAGQAQASVQQAVPKIETAQHPFDKALAECGSKLCASGMTLDPSAGTPTGTIPTEAVATVAVASLGAAAVYTFNKLQRDCPHGRELPPHSSHGNHG